MEDGGGGGGGPLEVPAVLTDTWAIRPRGAISLFWIKVSDECLIYSHNNGSLRMDGPFDSPQDLHTVCSYIDVMVLSYSIRFRRSGADRMASGSQGALVHFRKSL